MSSIASQIVDNSPFKINCKKSTGFILLTILAAYFHLSPKTFNKLG